MVQSGFCRGGVLAAIVWLAFPDIRRMPGWLWSVLFGILVVVVVNRKAVFLAIPIIIALAILKPRIGKRG